MRWSIAVELILCCSSVGAFAPYCLLVQPYMQRRACGCDGQSPHRGVILQALRHISSHPICCNPLFLII